MNRATPLMLCVVLLLPSLSEGQQRAAPTVFEPRALLEALIDALHSEIRTEQEYSDLRGVNIDSAALERVFEKSGVQREVLQPRNAGPVESGGGDETAAWRRCWVQRRSPGAVCKAAGTVQLSVWSVKSRADGTVEVGGAVWFPYPEDVLLGRREAVTLPLAPYRTLIARLVQNEAGVWRVQQLTLIPMS